MKQVELAPQPLGEGLVKFNLTYFNMKSIWKILRENREECEEFLKNQPDEKFVFAEYDEDEMEWVNPREEDEDYKFCDINDVAPFVTYANDNGYVSEYIVTEIHLDEAYDGRKSLAAKLKGVQDYGDELDVPVSWLYGASECYIYEMLMDLDIVKRK